MNQINLPMQLNRLDSCRSCGTTITVKSRCQTCKVATGLECKGCEHWTEDPPPHDCKMFLN